MEKEFWVLMLRWAMALGARFFAGERHPEKYTLLKEETQNFINRCAEGR